MRKPLASFFLLIVLLNITITASNEYIAADQLPQNISPLYSITTTLLHWNGTGYLPVTIPGDGKTLILATAGYKALITNITVLNETKEKCTIRVEYIITKVYGANVPINKTLSRTFVVDPRTNSFILNGTTAFFPFYVCKDNLNYTYHFNNRIDVKKSGDFAQWENVTYEGKTTTLEFGPLYTIHGKDIMSYLCSSVDLKKKKCIRFDQDPSPLLDSDFSSHYLVSIYGIFPGDPLGVLNGPMEVSGNIVKSEKTAKLLGARAGSRSDEEDPAKYLGAFILLIAGVILWRVRR
jgi:hypothetical protein